MVSLPTPFSVTTQEFSMPTGPTPGNTILGSRANTIPSSNSCLLYTSLYTSSDVKKDVDQEGIGVLDDMTIPAVD